ncbi:MAG: RNA polymerase sigma factor (sigma-70 family) [Chlamydiales bacterium]|jgi:RNA polymerase sigma factor (sigma-70 family)
MSRFSRSSVTLLQDARQGRVGAREELFERLEPLVQELVRRRMGPRLRQRAESVDMVQSVLGDALTGIERFEPDGDGALLRWLARITENKLRKQARGMRYGDRDPARQQPIGPAASEARAFDPAGSDPSPSERMVLAEERQGLRQLIERLPPRERTLVRLRKLDQLSWDEVLERSGEDNMKAARSAFARAMGRLAHWAARGSSEPDG